MWLAVPLGNIILFCDIGRFKPESAQRLAFTMSLQSRGTVNRDDKGVNTYCFARVFLFQYKDRIYQLLREARLYNPSLPNFDR